VVASIGYANDAAAFCAITRPELVIMDVCTENGESGLDAAAKILKNFPWIKVIVTSGFDEITYSPRAKELGAHAFVYKTKGIAHYREVAKHVLDGGFVFPEPKKIPLPHDETPFTSREMEVLRLLCGHMPTQEIADTLMISQKTVHRHMENMVQKAGLKSSMELVVYVLSNGWINPGY
jgi:DNA-binding NarL/FixJ family response regulator